MPTTHKLTLALFITTLFTPACGSNSSDDGSSEPYYCLNECNPPSDQVCSASEACIRHQQGGLCRLEEPIILSPSEVDDEYPCLDDCTLTDPNCADNETCAQIEDDDGVCIPQEADCPADTVEVLNYGCLPECDPSATDNTCDPDETCQLTGDGFDRGACYPPEP